MILSHRGRRRLDRGWGGGGGSAPPVQEALKTCSQLWFKTWIETKWQCNKMKPAVFWMMVVYLQVNTCFAFKRDSAVAGYLFKAICTGAHTAGNCCVHVEPRQGLCFLALPLCLPLWQCCPFIFQLSLAFRFKIGFYIAMKYDSCHPRCFFFFAVVVFWKMCRHQSVISQMLCFLATIWG